MKDIDTIFSALYTFVHQPTSEDVDDAHHPWVREHFPAVFWASETAPLYAREHPKSRYGSLHEWNPVSQRVHHPVPDEKTSTATRYVALRTTVKHFSEFCHELMHVVLWEPFFVGKLNPMESQETLDDFHLLTEAFCFWYGDIQVYLHIARDILDDPQLIWDSVGWEGVGTPASFLEDFGLRTPCAQLELYLMLFGRSPDVLEYHEEDPRWRAFRSRVFRFILGADRSASPLTYRIWDESSIRDEFFRRFCKPGLPELFSLYPLENSADAVRHYVAEFLRVELPALARLDPATVRAVRERRLLQAWAYFVMQLRHAHRAGLLMTETLETFSAPWIHASLESALDCLEKGLDELKRGTGVPSERRTEAARHVDAAQAPMRAQHVFVGRRICSTPERPVPMAVGELLDDGELRGAFELGTRFSPSWEDFVEHGELCGLVGKVAKEVKEGRLSRRALSAYLVHPAIRQRWTVEPGTLSLPSGTLRELLFELR